MLILYQCNDYEGRYALYTCRNLYSVHNYQLLYLSDNVVYCILLLLDVLYYCLVVCSILLLLSNVYDY